MVFLVFLVQLLFQFSNSQTTPKPCCVGRQFTATLFTVVGSYTKGVPSTAEKNLQVQYDFDAKMVFSNYTDGTTILENYNTRKRYLTTKTSCTKLDLDSNEQMIGPCIPSEAQYRGRHTIGDATPMDVDTWYLENTPLGNITLSVTADDCTPVIQGISANANDIISQTTSFVRDVVYGSIETSLFQEPHPCN